MQLHNFSVRVLELGGPGNEANRFPYMHKAPLIILANVDGPGTGPLGAWHY